MRLIGAKVRDLAMGRGGRGKGFKVVGKVGNCFGTRVELVLDLKSKGWYGGRVIE